MENLRKMKKELTGAMNKIALAVLVLGIGSCDFGYDLPEENSKVDTKPPVSFFGATVRGDDEWNMADFVNGSVGANSYVWDFGDGSETSDEFEPTHSYPPFAGPIQYTVTLTVSDANEQTAEYSAVVTIETNGIVLTDYNLFYDLVNEGDAGEPVTINDFSSYEIPKDRFPRLTLDKDPGTYWTAEDEDPIPGGEYRGDGEFVIYDLASSVPLRVIQFTTDVKADAYGYQIWVSNTGTADGDFTKIVPETGDIQLSIAASAEDQAHEIEVDARYVKFIGFGRFNEAGDERVSKWTNIGEIEFFKER